MSFVRTLAAFSVAIIWAIHLIAAEAQPDTRTPATPSSTVGMASTIEDLILPAPQLEPIPVTDRKQPIIVRIVDVKPHGTAFRYTIEFTGFEAGDYDLNDYLQPVENAESSIDHIPTIPVHINALLAASEMEPRKLGTEQVGWYRDYRSLMIAAGVFWVFMLFVLLRRRKKVFFDAQSASGPTIQDRLAPLFAAAEKSGLTDPQRAELERLVLAWCRERLSLSEEDAAEAMPQLRAHEKTSEVVRKLEECLHAPSDTKNANGSSADHRLLALKNIINQQPVSSNNGASS